MSRKRVVVLISGLLILLVSSWLTWEQKDQTGFIPSRSLVYADSPPPDGHGVPILLRKLAVSVPAIPDGSATYRSDKVILTTSDDPQYFVGSPYSPTYTDRPALGSIADVGGEVTVVRVPPGMIATMNWDGIANARMPSGYATFLQIQQLNPGSSFNLDEATLNGGWMGKLVEGQFQSCKYWSGTEWLDRFGIPIWPDTLSCLDLEKQVFYIQITVSWTGITQTPGGMSEMPETTEVMLYATLP